MKKLNFKLLFILLSGIIFQSIDAQVCIPAPGSCPSYPSSCNYQPKAYYTFDNACDPLNDCVLGGPASTAYAYTNFNAQINTTNSSGIAGSYCKIRESGQMCPHTMWFGNPFFYNVFNTTTYNSSTPKEYTYEFVFRLNSDFYDEIDFELCGLTFLYLGQNALFFQSQYYTAASTYSYSQVSHNLNGLGRLSSSYFLDHNWHHIVLKFDGNAGYMSVWIDGQTATQLKTLIPVGAMPSEPLDKPGVQPMGLQDNGTIDIDEVAFYDKALPDNWIIQHYNDVMNGQHYSCSVNPNIVVPTPQNLMVGNYDPLDFVPQHLFYTVGSPPTNYPATLDDLGSSVPSVLHQLKDYPLPRLKKGHHLNPNINWTGSEYLGRVNKLPNVNNDVNVQEELSKNWNYMFNLNSNGIPSPSSSSYQSTINSFANSHPNYKYSLITNINQTIGNPPPSVTAFPYQNCNPASCTPYSFMAPNNNTNLYFSALGNHAASQIINNIILGPTTQLTRPIDYLSENGMEGNILTLYPSGCPYNDPVQAPLGLFTNNYSSMPGGGWLHYYGDCRRILENTYKNNILNAHPLLHNAKYSKYDISGAGAAAINFLESYDEYRLVNTPITSPFSNNQNHYSTPPIYVIEPARWYSLSPGPNWTWYQMMANAPYNAPTNPESRIAEITLGDSLFAPFVAAGWTEEAWQLRPGQWLGLLKGMSVIGADYFHTSYFNETDLAGIFPSGTTFPVDPRGWCYQTAMPSYAQGIASRFEKYLHASSIIYHKVRNQTLIVARELQNSNNGSKYLIYGSLQQLSNYVGNTPLSTTYFLDDNASGANINQLKFEIRRQGSSYIYEPVSGVFYQLDKWHESTHPSYWSKDFEFEAELNDYTGVNNSSGINDHINNTMALSTEVPNATAPKDFTNYTTFIKYSNTSPQQSYYYFEPRDPLSNSIKPYYIWIKARDKSSLGALSKMDIDIRDVANNNVISSITIPCIDGVATGTGTTFKWYNVWVHQGAIGATINTGYSVNLTTNTEYEIMFRGNPSVEFDKFIVSEQSGIPSGVDPLEIANVTCPFSNKPLSTEEAGEANKQTGEISISPNPTTGKITITLKGNKDEYFKQFKVYNTQGQQIFPLLFNEMHKNTVEIDLGGYKNGIYFIETTTSHSTKRNKIILNN